MIEIVENESLTSANTLALASNARYFSRLTHADQLPELITFATEKTIPFLVIGGGSNVVMPPEYPGLIISNELKGIQFNANKPANELPADWENTGNEILLTAASGENWHQLVTFSLSNCYYGLENLALIPGSVGAAPVQNIGAYGVELQQFFHSLTGWDCKENVWKTLKKEECEFSYRHSIFKAALKNQFVITKVTLVLSTKPQVNTQYKALNQQLLGEGISNPDPQQVADAVVAIRQSKLPDPQELPNVGSFFKNPIVSAQRAEKLTSQFPDVVVFDIAGSSDVKLSAGWLVEQAGWKGRRMGKVGMHDKQSLVLVNYSDATACDVMALAISIQQTIIQQFNVTLEIEPDLILGDKFECFAV